MKSRKKKQKNKLITCVDVPGKKYKFPLKDYVFRPSIYAIIIKNGKILLSRQWDGYDLPGGGIDVGESLDKALMREVKEETGLTIKKGELIDCQSTFFLGWVSKTPWQGILIYTFGKIIKGKITDKFLQGEEKQYAKKAQWVSLKKIKNIKFYSSGNVLAVIKKALKVLKYDS